MSWQVLNEVVVDRGPSSYLSNVDVFLDGHLITTVQGDGESASWVKLLMSSCVDCCYFTGGFSHMETKSQASVHCDRKC